MGPCEAGCQHGRRCRPSGGALLAIPQPARWETCVLGATCDENAGQVEPKMGKLAKMGPEIWGRLPAEPAAPAAGPSHPPSSRNGSHPFSAVQDPRLEPHDLAHGPGACKECWHELTVSKFPQGFTFLRLFFALRVHPLFGMETTPLSRLCPGSQRDWLDWSPCVTDSSARAEIQGLRSIYGDGRTVCRFGIGCQ